MLLTISWWQPLLTRCCTHLLGLFITGWISCFGPTRKEQSVCYYPPKISKALTVSVLQFCQTLLLFVTKNDCSVNSFPLSWSLHTSPWSNNTFMRQYFFMLFHLNKSLHSDTDLCVKYTTNGRGSFSWMMDGPSSSKWDSSFVSSLVSDWGNMKRKHWILWSAAKQPSWYLCGVSF